MRLSTVGTMDGGGSLSSIEVKGIAAGDIRINSSEKVVKYLVHRQESLRTNVVPVFVWNHCRLDCERCEHRRERMRSAVGI